MHKRLRLNDFKKAIADGDDPGRCLIPKGLACKVAKADDDDAAEGMTDRQLQFTISTGSVDRDNDTVNPKGATNLDSFHETGVVLWAHDSRLPPIAKPVKAWTEGNAIKSIAEFAPADMDHPLGMGFGETIRRQFVEGFMKSVSIGFIPDTWKINEERTDPESWWAALDFLSWELLEFSPVPVPANREALVELAAKGMDMSGVFGWAARCLDDDAGKLIVPRRLVEDAHKGLGELYGEGQKVFDFGKAKAPADADPAQAADVVPVPEAVEPDGTPIDPPAEGEVLPDDVPAGDVEPKAADAVEVKRGRVLSKKNEKGLKEARENIDAVLQQVAEDDEADAGADEGDDDKTVADELEAMAEGDAVDLALVDRIVRAAAKIAHKARPDDPVPEPQPEKLTEADVVKMIREVVREEAVKAIKHQRGQLP